MPKTDKYAAIRGLSMRDRILYQIGKLELKKPDKAAEKQVNPETSNKQILQSVAKKRKKRRKQSRDKMPGRNDENLNRDLAPERKADRESSKSNRKIDKSSETLKKKVKKRKKNVIEAGQTDNNAVTDKGGLNVKQEDTLQEKLMRRLAGSRFRYLNELLYTSTGEQAQRMFSEDVGAFNCYHEGYLDQLKRWPTNPLDHIARSLSKSDDGSVIADMGCGDARLAQSLKRKTVHSFDLIAINERVTACDMKRVPLGSECVDICVFCLSLMGTNLAEYLREANRILKIGGTLKIAEVMSRFTSMRNFHRALEKLGFKLMRKKELNKFFVLLNYKKSGKPTNKRPPGLLLKPCRYKQR